MLTKIYKFIPVACLSLVLMLALPGSASGKGLRSLFKKEKKEAADTTAKKKITPYEKLFKGKKTTTAKGLITLHDIDGKVYMEFPVSLMGRSLLIGTTIEQSSDSGYGHVGQQPIAPYHVTLVKKDSTLYLRQVFTQAVSDDDSIEKALAASSINPIEGKYAIKAYNADSSAVVFDATALFLDDYKKLSPMDTKGCYWSFNGQLTNTASFKSDRSRLLEVKATKDYASVMTEMTYELTLSHQTQKAWENKPVTMIVNRTIVALPEENMMPRLADPRIGCRPVTITKYYAATGQGSKEELYASRRNIFTPEGEIKPIVFYVDTLFENTWVKAIREGIEIWNQAFAEMGYKDVLQVKMFPADKDFDSNNIHGSYIKCGNKPTPLMYTRTWTDPRSGEIFGSTTLIPTMALSVYQMKQFFELSTADEDSRGFILSDAKRYALIKTMVARTVGLTLGMEYNYTSATAYPTDSLRSATFTGEHGLCSSILSPALYNIVAQPEDVKKGVKLINDVLGPYDYYAIRWLYEPVRGAKTPEDESPVIDRMIAEKVGDPRYRFLSSSYYQVDPRAAQGTLGSDFVKTMQYQFKNWQSYAANAVEWLKNDDPDFELREGAYANLVMTGWNGRFRLMFLSMGGLYVNDRYQGDDLPSYQVIPREERRRMLFEGIALIEKCTTLDGDNPKERYKDMLGVNAPGRHLQQTGALILPNLIGYADFKRPNAESSYSSKEVMADVTEYALKELKAGQKLTDYKKLMIENLVNNAVNSSKVKDKEDDPSQSLYGITESRTGSLLQPYSYEQSLYGDPVSFGEEQSGYGPFSILYDNRKYNDHVFYGALKDLRTVLEREAGSNAQQDSRIFCKYLVNKIDRALRIK